jgi:fatty acid synthase
MAWLWRTAVLAVCIAIALAAKVVFQVVRASLTLQRQFKGPPSSSLLLGNKDFTSPQRHLLALDWANTYGQIVHLRLAWINAIMISDPVIAAEVLNRREFDKEWQVYKSISKMMSPSRPPYPDLEAGLTDDWWRLFRKGLAPAFNPANIRSGFPITIAACQELAKVLEDIGPDASVDIDQALMCETMDVISRFAFGADFGAVQKFSKGEVADLMDVLHRAESEVELQMGDPLREWTWWLSAEGRRAADSYRKYQGIMLQLLRGMQQRMGTSPPLSNQSLGAYMLRLRDPKTGQPLPDERLLPHIGMIYFAGTDTTAHTMAFALFFIAQHPEVEGKICAELEAHGLLASPDTPTPRSVAFEDLSGLTYLGAAIKEAMRMKPAAASGTMRVCQKACTLGNGRYHIPAKTGLWTPWATMHNVDANWGPTAGQYLPERWLQPGSEYMQSPGGETADKRDGGDGGGDLKHATASSARNFEMGLSRAKPDAKVKRFLPFSDGRRDCIGQALAKTNYTAVLASLLGRFHFELAPEVGGAAGVRATEHMAITLKPGAGLRMLCRPRSLAAG